MATIKITKRLPYETGRDYACRTIKENIIHLELIPGSLVSEKELAQQLGLSRTPVREALIDLAKVGIVEVLPQRGSRISYISYQLVDEARFMRCALEIAVCRKICPIATLENTAMLTENIRQQELCTASDDSGRFLELDDQFHQYLFQLAGMPHAHGLISSFTVHFDRVRNLSLHTVSHSELISDHRALVFALLSHDEQLAQSIVEQHLSRYKLDEAAIRRQYPSYFSPQDQESTAFLP